MKYVQHVCLSALVCPRDQHFAKKRKLLTSNALPISTANYGKGIRDTICSLPLLSPELELKILDEAQV